jgi:hypothetical protein
MTKDSPKEQTQMVKQYQRIPLEVCVDYDIITKEKS